MMRRGGVRRVVRWGGVAAAAVLPVVWWASLYRGVTFVDAPRAWCTGVGRGVFRVASDPALGNWPGPAWSTGNNSPRGPLPVILMPEIKNLAPGWRIDIPLWMPWLCIAGFTAWRFRADRVKPPHLCRRCGYDRRGLDAAAACPECGAGAG
jgi:hypothetical protein